MAQHLAADIHCHLIAGVNQLRFCAASLAACLANRIGNQRLILRQLRGLQHQRGVGGRILGANFLIDSISPVSATTVVYFFSSSNWLIICSLSYDCGD